MAVKTVSSRSVTVRLAVAPPSTISQRMVTMSSPSGSVAVPVRVTESPSSIATSAPAFTDGAPLVASTVTVAGSESSSPSLTTSVMV